MPQLETQNATVDLDCYNACKAKGKSHQECMQECTSYSLYHNGSADAALGVSPQSNDEAYLDGYLSQLKTTILEGTYTLQVRWLSQSFLRRAYD